MKTKSIILFILIGIFFFGCKNDDDLAQGESMINNSFSDEEFIDSLPQNLAGYDIESTRNGFIITGSDVGGDEKIFVLNLTHDFSIIWNEFFGGFLIDEGYEVKPTLDEGFIVAGSSSSFSQGLNDAFILKLDESGNEEWKNSIGSPKAEKAYSIVQTTDSGYVFCGFTSEENNDLFGTDLFIVKTNYLGEEEWSLIIDSLSNDKGYTITDLGDENLVISSISFDLGASVKLITTKVNIKGEVVASKSIDLQGISNTSKSKIVKLKNSELLVVSSKEVENSKTDIILFKLNSDLDIVWERTFGGKKFDYGKSVIELNNGDYLILGDTNSFGNGGNDIMLTRINANGELIWAQTYGGSGNESGYDLLENNNNEIIICGTNFVDDDNVQLIIFKVDSFGFPIE